MPNLAQLLTSFLGPRRAPEGEAVLESCSQCRGALGSAEIYQRYRVCPHCGHHFSISARQRIATLVDQGVFREINRSLASVDPLSFSDRGVPYRARVSEAQRRTGLADAVVTGIGRLSGQRLVLGAMDFDFLGGSMGSVVGEKITLALEMAARKRLPAVLAVTSGGARMQEGMLSLVQMAKTAAAAQRLHRAGLPLVLILANPTTGGVFASFASLGDLVIAEPKALIGFAGPRVAEQVMGRPLPPGSHTAEFLLEHGLADTVLSRDQHRQYLGTLLALLARPKLERGVATAALPAPEPKPIPAWETVQWARHPQRPTAMDYIERMTGTFVELHGDRYYGDDPAIVAGIADLDGQTVVLIGQERGHGDPLRREGRTYPEGYRKALRAMELAAKYGLPLVTLVDTPGAYPGLEAEERGLARAIARCLASMSELPVPIVSAVIGEGGSGGALALALADRILIQEHAVYSVIAPEGAATILYRDAARAEELSASLKLTAPDCLELGVIDAVVPEPAEGAHQDPDRAATLLRAALLRELSSLLETTPKKLVQARYAKFRRMGEFSSYYRQALQQELSQLQETWTQRWEQWRSRLTRRRREVVEESPV